MSLPNNFSNLDSAYGGLPYVVWAAPSLGSLQTMDNAYGGLPFIVNDTEISTSALRATQVPVEVLRDNDDPGGGNFRITQISLEILKAPKENVYLTMLPLEVLREIGSATASQAARGKSWMVFDKVNYIDVTFSYGTAPSSAADDYEVLNGANIALWGSEIVQFRDVTSLGGNRYRLSHLLRGRFGTEWAMRSHLLGDRFIMLDTTSIKRTTHPQGDIGVGKLYKAVTIGQTLSSAVTRGFANYAAGLKPYAPCHVTGSRDMSDNLTISWFRRSRVDAEWRDAIDVPIGEDSEFYEIDVLDGSGNVLRTIEATTTTASYTAAEQTTDFGSPQDSIAIVVYQLSATVGRGYGTSKNV